MQDYDTLKGLLLEEAYEVVDAANARDFDGLEDELGDLLFLVVFYSRIAEEEGRFAIDDVVEHVHAKLIRRHPHVFGKVQAGNAGEALQSWMAVKEQEALPSRASAPGSPCWMEFSLAAVHAGGARTGHARGGGGIRMGEGGRPAGKD